MSSILCVRRDVMIDAIREHLSGTSICASNAVYLSRAWLPREVDHQELMRPAAKDGLSTGRLTVAAFVEASSAAPAPPNLSGCSTDNSQS